MTQQNFFSKLQSVQPKIALPIFKDKDFLGGEIFSVDVLQNMGPHIPEFGQSHTQLYLLTLIGKKRNHLERIGIGRWLDSRF